MKVSSFIYYLNKFINEHGDLQVKISDGLKCNFYHTNGIEIQRWIEDDGTVVCDLGIGGLEEDTNDYEKESRQTNI